MKTIINKSFNNPFEQAKINNVAIPEHSRTATHVRFFFFLCVFNFFYVQFQTITSLT